MIRGLYTATSGMIVQQRKQENVANNLANAETPSFKKQTILIKAKDQANMIKNEDSINEVIGKLSFGSEIDGVKTDFTQGIMTETGRVLDYALDGAGFFQIYDEAGQLSFSRNGSFKIDGAGYLTNSQNYALVGKNIATGENEKINLGDVDFTIKGEGTIVNENGEPLYTLMISDFANYDDLENLGIGVYLNKPQDGMNTEVMAEDYKLVQGFKEASNINVLDEMVKMIEISRAFESNQRVVQAIDEMLSKAVNEVGKL
ncbi:MAG: flagellar hook-basal body complex protein [Clostridiales bacterium]|nr:flagellar hook-basal body complex protein [Clostridiales bacterium]